MHSGHQMDRWDHTAAILAAWSDGTPAASLNPYRRKKKRYMQPAELHAIARSIAKRKAQN